ncbi:hypothetical protein GCM10025867_15760 [Frondihabitans sucicola]|uniref:DUF317 domain-containing protein n=1 Tax=Frondihabitans sucicola TaxID=1268041 RepID=A0ABN6Y0D3_9MICO|nr:hypothetical protein [Frondihabitans sucicola]BDZ49335.1 hypothetical protein GCM10025867_15760 [Frondihabitans sucicola]
MRWLSELELSIALTSWFPAPWTPAALAQSLARVHQDAPVLQDRAWAWLSDPDFAAEPNPAGGWIVTRSERGDRETAHLTSDHRLTVMWQDHFRGKFAFPLAHSVDPEDVAALAAASLAAQEFDERDADYSYRTSWRATRDEALATARRYGHPGR